MSKGIRRVLVIVIVLAVLLLVAVSTIITTVPTGHTGILTTFGRVENVTLEAGLQIKAPWQGIITMDNREQRKTFQTAAFSSDIQQVDIQGSINYNINKSTVMNLYRTVGIDYYNTLIYPRLMEDVKAIFSKSTAEGLVRQRDTLSTQVQVLLSVTMREYGINIVKVAIEDIDFTDAYTNAVEAKQVAEQEKLKAETDQAKLTIEKRAEAERKVLEAEADAEARRKAADAEAYEIRVKSEAESEANKKVAQSITQQLIEYVKWQGWNGEWPTVMASGDVLPMVSIGDKSPGK